MGRLLRTLRHLRLDQIAWRLRYRLLRPWEEVRGARLRRALEGTVEGAAVRRDAAPPTPWPRPLGTAAARVGELQRGELTLLNETRPFRGGQDWCMQGCRREGRLWTYNLHYHVWLLDLLEEMEESPSGDSRASVLLDRVLSDWIATCRPGEEGFTHFAWNSFTIATRLAAWGRLQAIVPARFWARRPRLRGIFEESFAMQAAYLADHVEWDLRGNHLLRDAVGLAWGGRVVEHPAAASWAGTADEIAVTQAEEQVLADGGHFERSPMYHVHVMEDILSLALLTPSERVRADLAGTWERMAEALAWMRHPDGGIPLLNDATFDGAGEPGPVLESGRSLGLYPDTSPRRGGVHLPDTGLAIWHGRPWSVFFDVGEIGPDYQPGHAHADTLSLEASFRGRRLFVDPGTFHYDDDARRRRDRSTASHNTVTIDGEDSSEVWHIFRVGRRARPIDVEVTFRGNRMVARGGHDGYDHLSGRPRHGRRVEVRDDGALIVTDHVTGGGLHSIEGGFLLHPDWEAEVHDTGWSLRHPELSGAVRVSIEGSEGLELATRERSYSPGYGISLSAARLEWAIRTSSSVRVRASVQSEG